MPLVPLSVRKVSQVIPGGQQEGEHGVVQHVEGEHHQLYLYSLTLLLSQLSSPSPKPFVPKPPRPIPNPVKPSSKA